MYRSPRTIGIALAALAASLVVVAPAGAHPTAAAVRMGVRSEDVSSAPATLNRPRAVQFLVSSLSHGTHLEFAGGKGPDYGGTADLAVALAAAGGHDSTLRTVLRHLVRHVDAYVDPHGKQSFPGPFTGAAGKLAVLAEITGQHPREFGGVNLVDVLISNVCTAPKGGKSGPCSAKGDFYQAFSTVGQALGVLGLARAHVPIPGAALRRLIGLQCADGGFSSTLISGRSRCTSDVDTTGFAIQALAPIPSANTQVMRAAAFLRTRQHHDGGWSGASGENSNSTALAVQGLLASGSGSAAVQRGLRFLAGRQNGNGGFGISAASPKSDVLATSQTVPAIYRATLNRLSHPVRLEPHDAGGRGLPDTGASSGLLLSTAAAFIVLGGALIVMSRNRRTTREPRR